MFSREIFPQWCQSLLEVSYDFLYPPTKSTEHLSLKEIQLPNTFRKSYVNFKNWIKFLILFIVCLSDLHCLFGIFGATNNALPTERCFWQRILLFLQLPWAIWVVCGPISQFFYNSLSLHLPLSFRRNAKAQYHTQGISFLL